MLKVDELEYRASNRKDTYNWDAEGWIGEDYNKLWLKTEGERLVDGKVESAEVQALYSRLISTFFDVQAGVRYDFKPVPKRTFGVLGVQGLAPYFFEVDAASFVSDHGEVSGRLKASYDLLFTQRLILEPSFETNIALQSVKERGVGSGINDVGLSARLRYEIFREFAPYIGVNYERKLGQTASYAKDEGEEPDNLSFVVGLRFWF
ncbi:copper resistance protein B [Ferrovibrio sp.]